MNDPNAQNISGGKTVPHSDLRGGTVLGEAHITNHRIKIRKKGDKWKHKLIIGTWNVQTMLQPGKMREVADEMNRFHLDIIALQEIRWQGQGVIEKRDFKFIYSGPAARTGQFGTGFIMNKKVSDRVIGIEPISDRICKLRMKGHFRNITLISVHAPTEDKSDEEKEEFYGKLTRVYGAVPKYDLVIILGDFNAKIGKENFLKGVAGKFSLHNESSDNGRMLVEFATACGMIIKSTSFDHKRIHLGTWRAPGTDLMSQIDHVLVSKRHATSVVDTRAMRGPNCDTDHYLVRAVVREKLAMIQKDKGEKRMKWDVDKLKDGQCCGQYQLMIANRLDKEINNIEEKWTNMKEAVIEAAREIVGVERRKQSEWFDDECREAIQKKNEYRRKMLERNTRQNSDRYRASRREANHLCKKKKREYMKEKVRKIEELSEQKKTKNLYNEIRSINRSYQPKLNICKDKDGKLIAEDRLILNRWAEYFEEILNKPDTMETVEENVRIGPEPYVEIPSVEEVRSAINRLKNGKAPGEDQLSPELIKKGGGALTAQVHDIVCSVWEKETMPNDWKTGVICPVFKKGDKTVCSNYRGITLLSCVYKIFSMILLDRLNVYAEEILSEHQSGFRADRSTVDQIFVMRQSLERCFEYGIDLHILFIDFRQAFDSVNRKMLRIALEDLGVPQKIVRLVLLSLNDFKGKVVLGRNKSRDFTVGTGVKQGDALSATLFNLALHYAINKIDFRGHIFKRTRQLGAYADDIVLVARNKNVLKDTFIEMEREVSKIGLEVNEAKTKYMKVSAKENRELLDLHAGHYCFQGVTEFKYLGVILNNENRVSSEIVNRIITGNRAYYANRSLLKSKLLTPRTKLILYKTLIRPVVTYASETWTLVNKDISALRIFERRILRRIFGPVKEGNMYRIRNNSEINELIGGQDLVRHIKSARIRWLGHVSRMNVTRIPKTILSGTIFGKRRRGRPRRRWQQDVEEDLRTMDIRNWRLKAMDRDEWRRVVAEAKAHHGL